MKRKIVSREHNTTVTRKPNKTITRSEQKTVSRHYGRLGAKVMKGLSALSLSGFRMWQQIRSQKPAKAKRQKA